MTRSQIFKAAHEIARSLEGNYRACFAMALDIVRNEAAAIQQVKAIILDVNRAYGRLDVTGNDLPGYEICCAVEAARINFASDVASSVYRYAKASEKQAYVIARAYVQAGFDAGCRAMISAQRRAA
jgi:hypothetical protein